MQRVQRTISRVISWANSSLLSIITSYQRRNRPDLSCNYTHRPARHYFTHTDQLVTTLHTPTSSSLLYTHRPARHYFTHTGGHGEDFNPRPVSNIDNYFTTTGLNDIVFNILLPSNPGRLHGAMHLRQRGHNFVLPNIKYDFNKRHFIARSLFCYV